MKGSRMESKSRKRYLKDCIFFGVPFNRLNNYFFAFIFNRLNKI